MNRHFEEYAFSEVVTAIFNFFLYDLCDYYLELTKQRLAVCTPGEKSASRLSSLCALEVLYVCLDRGLRLLHPLCPFITEELHQRLPPNDAKPDSICIADYPQPVLQWIDHRLDVSASPLFSLGGQSLASGESSVFPHFFSETARRGKEEQGKSFASFLSAPLPLSLPPRGWPFSDSVEDRVVLSDLLSAGPFTRTVRAFIYENAYRGILPQPLYASCVRCIDRPKRT